MTVSLQFLGAARTVTGSCMLLETPRARLLVDCGMFQGPKTLKGLNYDPFPFDPARIDAVLLSHAHIDHSGLIPKLIGAGYRGRVHATPGTRDLCGVLLPDAGHIQELEVEFLNRRNQRHGKGTVRPIYTKADGAAALRRFRTDDYGAWFAPAQGVRARFWNAGHLLGSASVEVEIDGDAPLRLLFSGDLGPPGKSLQTPPEAPAGVDYLVCESTYGDTDRRDTTPAERRARLAGEVRAALNDAAPLLIPAFAVERTQELLVDLVLLMERGDIPPCPIYVDSPLAIRATDVFIRSAADLDPAVPVARLLQSPHLRFTESVAQSRAIGNEGGFHIILAGSGMCDAGRIRAHLRRWLWHRQASVLLTGFQAEGTLGRILQNGATSVRIQGDEITVRARVRWTDDYSGHADGPALAAWIEARRPVRSGIFLTHGEEASVHGLAARLHAPPEIVQPVLDAAYDLLPGGPRLRGKARAARLAPEQVGRSDWHNERSRLLLRISERLDAAADDAARTALLRGLSETLARFEHP